MRTKALLLGWLAAIIPLAAASALSQSTSNVLPKADQVAQGYGYMIAEEYVCNLPTAPSEQVFDDYLNSKGMRFGRFGDSEKARLKTRMLSTREFSLSMFFKGTFHYDCAHAAQSLAKSLNLLPKPQ